MPSSPHVHTVVVIGSGIGGLCMGIQLRRAGIDRFVILEKAARVGGTWRENAYPGSGCDIPSHLYSFSFAPNPGWTRKYSEQREIVAYLDRTAARNGLLPHIRFDTEVTSARFDEGAGLWRIRTRAGEELSAQVLVSATGQLNRPVVPHIPDREAFRGPAFHSAEWRADCDLRAKRVAVVGSGASAVQIVPRLAAEVGALSVFQRSPNWVVPRGDHTYGPGARWAFRYVPFLLLFYRAFLYLWHEVRFLGFLPGTKAADTAEQQARAHLEGQVKDPALRASLTPTFPIGCKRVLISDDYYPALTRPSVELVTEAIDRFTAEGITTKDGKERPFDAIVFATGFDTTSFLAPMEVVGRGGVRLADTWRGGAEAYLGVTVSGFPNLFLLYGPNTNLGHNSIIFMIECQVRYAVQCVRHLQRGRLAWLDVRTEAQATYNAKLQEDLGKTSWASPGCTSWYKTGTGKVTNNWSGFTTAYWWRTRKPEWAAFESRAV